MSLDAVAILHVPPSVALDAMPAHPSEPDARAAANGEAVRLDPLRDAVRLPLGRSLASEPEELVARIEALAGDLLAMHDEARGVPVYPSSYELTGATWAEVVEELGEAADWVGAPPAPPMDMFGDPSALMAQLGDPAALMQQLGGLDPSALAGMMPGAGGMDPSAMLGGRDPAAMMEAAMAMMGQLAESGGLEDMMKMVSQAAPADLLAQAGQGGMDVSQLAAQAEAMLAANPELEGKLRQSFDAAAAKPEAAPAAPAADGEEPAED